MDAKNSMKPERRMFVVAAVTGLLALAAAPSGARAAEPEVILISVPYGALPQVGRDYAAELKGTVVLETGNPYPTRDGDMAVGARAKGTGAASAEFLPNVRLVRAFNSLPADDAAALKIAARLIQDAGFEPVVVGPLARTKEFDVGAAVYGRALTARERRRGLGLGP